MKKRRYSLGVKILCFILCIGCLLITASCLIAGAFLERENLYRQSSEDSIYIDRVSSKVYEDALLLRWLTLEQKGNYTGSVYKGYYDPSISNLRYEIYIPHNGINLRYSNLDDTNGQPAPQWDYSYDCNMTNYSLTSSDSIDEFKAGHLKINIYIDRSFPISDYYSVNYTFVHWAYTLRYWVFVIAGVAFLISVITFIILMCIAGKTPDGVITQGAIINRVPFDIILAIATSILIACLIGLDWATGHSYNDWEPIVGLLIFIAVGGTTVISLLMSFFSRLRQRNLWKNTVTRRALILAKRVLKSIIKVLKSLFNSIPLIWKSIVIFAVAAFVSIIIDDRFFSYTTELGVFVWFLKNIIIFAVVVYISILLRKLQKGAEALAKGDLDYKTDTKFMIWDFKNHGESLNSIGVGMEKAIEERLRSERTKAELITNVSHDIKTPLTSIINYATLISENECENESHKEYSEVLVRKSEHLKRLLEDLVEISKATSGNLEVDLRPCEASVLLNQAAGEFQEKCDNAGLKLITTISDEESRILADSRRIWRVFENLMNNICKYSLPNSRVYLSLEKEGSDVLFIFRNTSKEPLNISPEELTERFVRGDKSRTTEGNGLGLSIAKSLVELQNGKMEIVIDGDLFKVVLRFPSFGARDVVYSN